MSSSKQPYPSLFGEMIRDARTRRQLSTTELADRCGVTQPLVVQWEKADHPLSERTLNTVAVALGMSVEELLTECLRARRKAAKAEQQAAEDET